MFFSYAQLLEYKFNFYKICIIIKFYANYINIKFIFRDNHFLNFDDKFWIIKTLALADQDALKVSTTGTGLNQFESRRIEKPKKPKGPS